MGDNGKVWQPMITAPNALTELESVVTLDGRLATPEAQSTVQYSTVDLGQLAHEVAGFSLHASDRKTHISRWRRWRDHPRWEFASASVENQLRNGAGTGNRYSAIVRST